MLLGFGGFPGGSDGKESACNAGNPESTRKSWSRKSAGGRAWQSTPIFLPEEFPWTEKPGGPQSMGLQKVEQDWATNTYMPLRFSEVGWAWIWSFYYSWLQCRINFTCIAKLFFFRLFSLINYCRILNIVYWYGPLGYTPGPIPLSILYTTVYIC